MVAGHWQPSEGATARVKIGDALAPLGVTAASRRRSRQGRDNGLAKRLRLSSSNATPAGPTRGRAAKPVGEAFGGVRRRAPTCAATSPTCGSAAAGTTFACWSTCTTARSWGIRRGRARTPTWWSPCSRLAGIPLIRHPGFHTDRGSGSSTTPRSTGCSDIRHRQSLSKKGCPCDNAVDESTNKILKAEFVYREAFATTHELRAKLTTCIGTTISGCI